MISHRMVQTGLGFSAAKPNKSTRKAARKSKQIGKLLDLLASNKRSLADTVSSLSYLVNDPVGSGKKGKKKKELFNSDLSL